MRMVLPLEMFLNTERSRVVDIAKLPDAGPDTIIGNAIPKNFSILGCSQLNQLI